MLLFSTVLSINDTLTKDAFIQLVIKWNQGSREENVIPGIEWNGERNIRYGNEKLWMQIEEYRNQNIIAVRYEKIEGDGVIWDSDYVMNFNEMRMSIRLDRSYLEEALSVHSAFHTPAFIALLIDGGYVKDDNGLPVGRRPVLINETNLSLIADVINGDVHYRLPVVYISKTDDERDPVNTREVAKRLKGVAHVFVQEHSWSGAAIHRLCNKKNEYNGAIGIYYPNEAVGHERILNHIYAGSGKRMTEKVISRVIQYSNIQRIDTLYTWQGVSNALLRDKYSSKREELAASESARRLSESAARMREYEVKLKLNSADQQIEAMRKEVEKAHSLAQENEDLVESVDEEMRQMRQQIEELTRKNDALTTENEGLWAKMREMSKSPILYLGAEDEFFQDEIKEIILESLSETLKKIRGKTRRADVLGDLIRSNGGFKGTASKKAEALKNTLRGYKNLSGVQKRFLEELGFKITKEGDHYKLVYYGDGRYWTSLAVTPSDHRTGENCAHQIIRNML